MHPSDPISVVITTYNRSDALLAVLHGLSLQTDRNFEVVVADDGSREEHRDALHQSAVARELGVVHVWHPDVGFTASKVRNRGVAAAGAPYLVFMDGDCVPEVDFVAQHKRLAQPGNFVNGSRVLLTPEMTADVVAGREEICGRGASYWFGQRLRGRCSKLTHLLRLPDGPLRVRAGFYWKGIRSCNMGVWRSDFEKVDGFDESFVGWGHEDADFVLRLHHAGVARKNGWCATEVFHLWHREAARDQASLNEQTVHDRIRGSQVKATSGYTQARPNDDVVITKLG